MEMRIQLEEDGQSSVYDAMMFLSIMLVASALIVGVSNHLLRADDVRSFDDLEQSSMRFANAVLTSTVPNASYIDGMGSKVTSRDISVQDMVIEELVLLRSGMPEENFDGADGYNERIVQVLSSLLDKDRFFGALFGQYGDEEIMLGDGFPFQGQQGEIAANTTRIPMPEEENDIIIIVYLWWK